jgi:pimeloyl-ACP methyl ester carboxylesterase
MKIIQAMRRGQLRLIMTLVLAVGVLLIPASQFASAGAASARSVPPAGPKPSIVLVHGAWADSSSWDAVVSLPSTTATRSMCRRTRFSALPTTPPSSAIS